MKYIVDLLVIGNLFIGKLLKYIVDFWYVIRIVIFILYYITINKVYLYQNLRLQILIFKLVFHGPCTLLSHHASVDTFSQLCNVVTLKSV